MPHLLRFVRIATFAFAPTLAVPGITTNKAALLAAGAAALETGFRVVCPDGAATLGKVIASVLKYAPTAASVVKATDPANAAAVTSALSMVE